MVNIFMRIALNNLKQAEKTALSVGRHEAEGMKHHRMQI